MNMIVIGTRYFSFSAINSLTEACAASSDVPLRALSSLPRFCHQIASFTLSASTVGCAETRGDLHSRIAAGWPVPEPSCAKLALCLYGRFLKWQNEL